MNAPLLRKKILINLRIPLIWSAACVLLSVYAGCSRIRPESEIRILQATEDILSLSTGADSVRTAELIDSISSLSKASETDLSRLILTATHALFMNERYNEVVVYNNGLEEIVRTFDTANKPTSLNTIDIALFVCASYEKLGMEDRALHGYELLVKPLSAPGMEDRLSVVLTNMANIHMNAGRHEKSIELQNRSLKLNQALGDTTGILYNYSNLASAFMDKGDNERAIEYRFMALHLAENPEDSVLRHHIQRNLATNYARMNEWSMAQKYLEPAMRYYERNGLISSLPLTYSKYADILMHQGNRADAACYHAMAMEGLDAVTPAEKMAILESYLCFLNADSATQPSGSPQVARRLTALSDTVANARTSETIEAMADMYNAEIDRLEKERLHDGEKYRRRMTVAICILAFLLLLIAGAACVIWRMRRLSATQRKKESDLLSDLEQMETREGHHKAFLSAVGTDLQALRDLLEVRNTQKSRLELRRILADVLSEADTDKENAVYKSDISFHQLLLDRFPALTQRDLKLCSLIRQGYSSKEMAEILCREVRSVETARIRLRKKMDLAQGTDLYLFLLSFDT